MTRSEASSSSTDGNSNPPTSSPTINANANTNTNTPLPTSTTPTHQFTQQIQQQQHQLQLYQQQQFQLQQLQLQHQQNQQVLQQFTTNLHTTSTPPSSSSSSSSSSLTPSSSLTNNPEFACENVGDRIKGKRRKYCPHEVTALVLGVQRYADDSCPWSAILRDPHLGHLFHGRSGVDLKDKWRTLIKTRPELSSYTENRKNHRKYRPFTSIEERALMEGVKKYNGQRNVWSLILVDKELGHLFNDRSNVQLKDKFRTMRRTSKSSINTSVETTETSTSSSNETILRPSGRTGTTPSSSSSSSSSSSASAQAAAVAASLVSLTPQQTQALLAHNTSGLLMDPSLYMGGSFALSPHVPQPSNRHAQIQAHAQAQAIAQAQARAQAQIQQMHAQHLRTQPNPSKQHVALGYGQIPAYSFMGNQLIPQQALYYAMNPSAAQAAAAHQQQLQHQQQLHAYQQRQAQLQQQQQAAAVAAAVMAAAQQQKVMKQGSSSSESSKEHDRQEGSKEELNPGPQASEKHDPSTSIVDV